MERKNRIILEKLLSEAKLIEEYIDGCSESVFLGDSKTQRAVCMTLVNIGELVKKLTDEVKADNQDIPWRRISDFRNIVAHEYEAVKMERVWETVTAHMPILQKQIENILDKNLMRKR